MAKDKAKWREEVLIIYEEVWQTLKAVENAITLRRGTQLIVKADHQLYYIITVMSKGKISVCIPLLLVSLGADMHIILK